MPDNVSLGVSQDLVNELIARIEAEGMNKETGADTLATAFAYYVQKHFERPGSQGMIGGVDIDMPNPSVCHAQPEPVFFMRVTLHPRTGNR